MPQPPQLKGSLPVSMQVPPHNDWEGPQPSHRDAEQLETHEERGDLLFQLSIPFAVLVLVGAWSLPGTSALASGRGAQESRLSVADKVLPVVLVLAAVGIIVLTVLTGDAGARAGWG